MQVRIEDVSPVEKRMFVEVPWETVSQKLGDAYKELGKGVALKGFRKGKVPRSVLEQVYGSRINEDVASQLVHESFLRASEEHNLAAVAEPRVEESVPIKKGRPFTFAAIIEIRGDVVPKDYVGLAIERRKLDIAEAAVDEALAQLRREHTELRPIEGRDVTAVGDLVGLSVTGTIGEHEINQPQFAVDLGEDEREPLPGMRQALLGVPLDTKDKKLEIMVPDDYEDESIRGRKAQLTMTILEVRAKEVPALDDEFAKDTGKAETLEALRGVLRQELEAREREVIDREAREGALRELIKNNQIPVASSLVERAVEIQYDRLRQMLGMKPERGNFGLDNSLREKMRPAGADEVRGQLLIEAIADKEGITVSDDELTAHIEATAKSRSMAPAKLRAEWQRDGRIDSITYTLRQDKVLAFLVEKAQVTEVEKLSAQGTPLPEAPGSIHDHDHAHHDHDHAHHDHDHDHAHHDHDHAHHDHDHAHGEPGHSHAHSDHDHDHDP
ncbi:MAG TPA: trigger factor [Kofleriaceae bacterium]|jgi:trigger factor|nr:trigger factor [Kofleriaceae bacterium]